MFKAVVKPLAFSLICFFAGYQFAVVTKSAAPTDTKQMQPTQKFTPTNQHSAHYRSDVKGSAAVDAELLTNPKNADAPEALDKLADSDLSKRLIQDDVRGMLTNLEALRADPSSAPLVATQYDVLKNFLIEHPESLDDIIAHLDSHPGGSASFDTVLSLAQALPSKHTDRALQLFAEQYAGAFDQDSQEKFIAVLSSSSNSIESEHILQSLVDLVVLGQADVNTKLDALNLVKPHQLPESEKTNIRHELSQLVTSANDQEAARLLPDLMRFSSKEQRAQIATTLLSQNRAGPIRGAVLDGISSGSIPASDDMKNILLEMASNPSDELRQAAFETLEYSFDLSQQEYSRLKPDL